MTMHGFPAYTDTTPEFCPLVLHRPSRRPEEFFESEAPGATIWTPATDLDLTENKGLAQVTENKGDIDSMHGSYIAPHRTTKGTNLLLHVVQNQSVQIPGGKYHQSHHNRPQRRLQCEKIISFVFNDLAQVTENKGDIVSRFSCYSSMDTV